MSKTSEKAIRIRKNFGKNLRVYRNVKELSQSDVAKKAGLSKSYLCRLENGDIAMPNSEKIRRIGLALELNTDRLMKLAGECFYGAEADGEDLHDPFVSVHSGITNNTSQVYELETSDSKTSPKAGKKGGCAVCSDLTLSIQDGLIVLENTDIQLEFNGTVRYRCRACGREIFIQNNELTTVSK